MENTKYTYNKTKYRKEICEHGKSIDDIAKECGMTSAAVRKHIRSLYDRMAWANKLIGMADANAVAKKEVVNAPVKVAVAKTEKKDENPHQNNGKMKIPYELERAIREGVAIVDTSYLMDFFDSCSKVKKLIIPRFCINEMKKIAQNEADLKRKAALEVRIKYLESEAEILFCENLPYFQTSVENKSFKPRSFNFSRYTRHVWEREGREIPFLTRSYEVRVLLKEFKEEFFKRATQG